MQLITEHQLATTNADANHALTRYLVTVPPQRFAHVAKQFHGRVLAMEHVELVDISVSKPKK